ncbi:DUF421 domain-containing protein [Paenibacillus wynnii]|uniref:DUF421 domain-containing protein n=1 Tax=Paenibacillus wynnii TaxID=268407 RepID=UPI003593CB03
MEFGSILIKIITGFFGLWSMARLLGKKEISALTPFDFISAVVLGDLVGNTIYETEHSVLKLIFTLVIWTLLSVLFEKITQFIPKLRKPLEGQAEILIHDGKIDLNKLHKNNLDFDQLRMMLRAKDTFSLEEVAFAIYETNGSLSILKKHLYQGVLRKDLNMPDQEVPLTLCIVENGVLHEENLHSLGKDQAWFKSQIEKKRCPNIKSIAYAEFNGEGDLTIIPSYQ